MSKYIEFIARVDADTVDDDFIELAKENEIIRCKDCNFSGHRCKDGQIECRLYSHPLRIEYSEMKPDDFCSYGERKENE